MCIRDSPRPEIEGPTGYVVTRSRPYQETAAAMAIAALPK
jgi:hypothetical protein